MAGRRLKYNLNCATYFRHSIRDHDINESNDINAEMLQDNYCNMHSGTTNQKPKANNVYYIITNPSTGEEAHDVGTIKDVSWDTQYMSLTITKRITKSFNPIKKKDDANTSSIIAECISIQCHDDNLNCDTMSQCDPNYIVMNFTTALNFRPHHVCTFCVCCTHAPCCCTLVYEINSIIIGES